MSRPDATASAILDAQAIRPVFFAYLDVVGDPLRANTSGHSIELSATGDPDLDGLVFEGVDPTFVDIGSVRFKDGGADSVTAKLSGIASLDTDLLNLIGDEANWLGRTGRLWRIIRDENGAQVGAIQHYYTGWMTSLTIVGADDGSQTIQVALESYLAAYTAPSNRTYLDQSVYDPGDQSAKGAIAIANGNTSNTALVTNTPGVSGSGVTSAGSRSGRILE